MITSNQAKTGRKERNDKKIRVNIPIHQDSELMLKRLSLACDISKTHMAAAIIETALRTPSFVNYLQDVFKADQYRIIPSSNGSQVVYVSANGN